MTGKHQQLTHLLIYEICLSQGKQLEGTQLCLGVLESRPVGTQHGQSLGWSLFWVLNCPIYSSFYPRT